MPRDFRFVVFWSRAEDPQWTAVCIQAGPGDCPIIKANLEVLIGIVRDETLRGIEFAEIISGDNAITGLDDEGVLTSWRDTDSFDGFIEDLKIDPSRYQMISAEVTSNQDLLKKLRDLGCDL
jgi:hypothetical protein